MAIHTTLTQRDNEDHGDFAPLLKERRCADQDLSVFHACLEYDLSNCASSLPPDLFPRL